MPALFAGLIATGPVPRNHRAASHLTPVRFVSQKGRCLVLPIPTMRRAAGTFTAIPSTRSPCPASSIIPNISPHDIHVNHNSDNIMLHRRVWGASCTRDGGGNRDRPSPGNQAGSLVIPSLNRHPARFAEISTQTVKTCIGAFLRSAQRFSSLRNSAAHIVLTKVYHVPRRGLVCRSFNEGGFVVKTGPCSPHRPAQPALPTCDPEIQQCRGNCVVTDCDLAKVSHVFHIRIGQRRKSRRKKREFHELA